MKKVFISGITGQDGAWLAKLLLEKGYKVYGGVRNKNNIDSWRLVYLGINSSIEYINFNLTDRQCIESVIQKIKPDEFYNLAAQSNVAESYNSPVETSLVDGMGVLYLLESIKKFSPHSKFFQASSSEIFGNSLTKIQNENTAMNPVSPYAVAKAYAHWMVINYRNSFNIYAINGILYAHESELRSKTFFTRKISLHVANWNLGIKKILEIGNLDAEKDWGYAKEFVEGIYLAMQGITPEDFIFATGTKVKLKSFIDHSYSLIGINLCWEGENENLKAYNSNSGELIIKTNPEFYRPINIHTACGDASKAEKLLNWKPKLNYQKISEIMIQADINKLRHE